MFHRNAVVAMSDQDLDELIKQTVLADATEAIHRNAGARVTSLVRQRLETPPRGRFAFRWRLGTAAVLAVMGLSGAVVAAALLPTKPITLLAGPPPTPATTPSLAPNQPGTEVVSLAQAQALVPFQILPLDYPNASLQKVLYTPAALLANGQTERGAVAGVSLLYQVGSLQIQLAESLNSQGALTEYQKPLSPGAANPDQVETIDGSTYLVSRHTSTSGSGVTAMTWQTAQNVVVSLFWYTPSANGGIPVPMTIANALNLVQSVS